VQEVFAGYASNENSFRGDCSIKTWFLVLTRNYCFNFIRKKGNNCEGIEDEDNVIANAVYPLYDDRISLEYAIENLPPGISELIFLKDYEGYSYKEIAGITNQTIENVKIKLFRGRQQLKKFLNDGI
jgi:RNA polymerase sigma-70 factor (ECF subfamily)